MKVLVRKVHTRGKRSTTMIFLCAEDLEMANHIVLIIIFDEKKYLKSANRNRTLRTKSLLST